MNNELSKVEELALSIATCIEIKTACHDKSHPCNLVVMDQEALGTEFRQSPEQQKLPIIINPPRNNKHSKLY